MLKIFYIYFKKKIKKITSSDLRMMSQGYSYI